MSIDSMLAAHRLVQAGILPHVTNGPDCTAIRRIPNDQQALERAYRGNLAAEPVIVMLASSRAR
jgi:hypothetical protein